MPDTPTTEPADQEYVPPALSTPMAKWGLSVGLFVHQGTIPMHLFEPNTTGEKVWALIGLVLTALALFAHAKTVPAGATIGGKK